jgi:hypothetical protein
MVIDMRKLTVAQSMRLDAERIEHQRRAVDRNRMMRNDGREKRSITDRVYAFVATTDKAFTSRDVAQAVWPDKMKINKYDTQAVGIPLRKLVNSGHVSRIDTNSKDTKNSGQLLYIKR